MLHKNASHAAYTQYYIYWYFEFIDQFIDGISEMLPTIYKFYNGAENACFSTLKESCKKPPFRQKFQKQKMLQVTTLGIRAKENTHNTINIECRYDMNILTVSQYPTAVDYQYHSPIFVGILPVKKMTVGTSYRVSRKQYISPSKHLLQRAEAWKPKRTSMSLVLRGLRLSSFAGAGN